METIQGMKKGDHVWHERGKPCGVFKKVGGENGRKK